jgi:hypothetical protein
MAWSTLSGEVPTISVTLKEDSECGHTIHAGESIEQTESPGHSPN